MAASTGALTALAAHGPSGVAVESAAAYTAAGVTEYGKVVFVADGDTIDVDIEGKADGADGTRIRFLTTQAMELTEYHHDLDDVRGECHAKQAAKALKQILFTDVTSRTAGRRVRLIASDPASSNLGREARFVAVKLSDGKWHDVGYMMIKKGLVLPSFHKTEYRWNKLYRLRSQQAAAAGAGLFDTNHCGSGPSARLSVTAHWDADGNDSANINGEYFKVTNKGSTSESLAGWWVRDSATRRGTNPDAAIAAAQTRRGFIFPSGASVGAGRSVYVHPGSAPSHRASGHYYMGLSIPIFENTTGSPVYLGDGGYLFDPQGDLRAWHQYPCVSSQARACSASSS